MLRTCKDTYYNSGLYGYVVCLGHVKTLITIVVCMVTLYD